MKIYVTGASGTLGKLLVSNGCEPLNCDITNLDEVKNAVQSASPDVLIHCAAITDVDYCETHFKESFDVNVRGTSNVAGALSANTLMIYLSTDHVFQGSNWLSAAGYSESHTPSPVNRYGFSKWGGELALVSHPNHLIVRTSKCYDIPWMMPTIEKLRNNEKVEFTSLIKRSFMYLPHFVESLLWIANNQSALDGINLLHVSGETVYSYAQFWKMLQFSLGLGGEIISIDIEKTDATPRPFKAGLDVRKAKRLGVPIGSLESALNDIEEKLHG